MTLPKRFNPEMLDEPKNTSLGSFTHDYEVECNKSLNACRNPAHYRLLNLYTATEDYNNFNRVEAMRELWHGGK